MRGMLLLAAVLLLASVTGAGAQLTGAPPPDARQLNFQLFEAAKKGRTGAVQLYLTHGASLKARDKKGLSPLIAAAFNGDEEMFRMLLEQGAETDVEDNYGKSAILYAAGKGFADIVGALLDTGVDVNKA